jgi:hypothetical protein
MLNGVFSDSVGGRDIKVTLSVDDRIYGYYTTIRGLSFRE